MPVYWRTRCDRQSSDTRVRTVAARARRRPERRLPVLRELWLHSPDGRIRAGRGLAESDAAPAMRRAGAAAYQAHRGSKRSPGVIQTVTSSRTILTSNLYRSWGSEKTRAGRGSPQLRSREQAAQGVARTAAVLSRGGAASRHFPHVYKLLVDHGADVETTKLLRTGAPLGEEALRSGHRDIADFLAAEATNKIKLNPLPTFSLSMSSPGKKTKHITNWDRRDPGLLDGLAAKSRIDMLHRALEARSRKDLSRDHELRRGHQRHGEQQQQQQGHPAQHIGMGIA